MKIFKIISAVITLAMFAMMPGCAKDPDSSPDSVTRESFIGKWLVQPVQKSTYEVIISADPNSSGGVFISNFAAVGSSSAPASAEVSGTSIILDADQVIGDDLKINGSGVLSGSKIIWHYTIFDGADLTTIDEIYTRL